MKWDCVVLGAGCAGLSAATKLASQGYRVLVIERKRVAGGRASSYLEKGSQEEIDNGQHLILGCYKHTLEFVQRIGNTSLLLRLEEHQTPIAGIDGSIHTLKSANLPAPFHMLQGLLSFKALSMSDRLKFLKLPLILSQKNLHTVSAFEWLLQLKQSTQAYEKFWEILILATLNADPKKVSADQLAVVLKDGFLSSKENSQAILSKVSLSQLFGSGSDAFLQSKKSAIQYKSIAHRLHVKDQEVDYVELLSGERIYARSFISSLPPPFLKSLCDRSSEVLSEFVNEIDQLEPSPILSLTFWCEQEIIQSPYAGMWGTKFHWIFRKDQYMSSLQKPHYTLVASAAFSMLHMSKDELMDLATKEINACFQVKIIMTHAVLSWEKSATWIAPIGNQTARLHEQSPIKNFLICGDWTQTDLPATIESACKSGHTAALKLQAFQGLSLS